MKNIFKFITSLICHILIVPCLLGMSVGAIWYLLPAFKTTSLGELFYNGLLNSNNVYVTLFLGSLSGLFILLLVLGKIFNPVSKSKLLNFYTHFVSWLMALILVVEAGYVFFAATDINTVAINISMVRRIGLLACILALFVYSMVAPKLRVLVDRRIQAYDTAKELNAKGRSSVVGMQLLKCFDFICPEVFSLAALCFAFNWEVSMYFIFFMSAFALPVIGNMICDYRVKKEAKIRERQLMAEQANATATAVVDLLKSQVSNNIPTTPTK